MANLTRLSSTIDFVKENWTILSFVMAAVIWAHAQFLLVRDTSKMVEGFPEQVRDLITCHRHMDDGSVIFLPCGVISGGSSAGAIEPQVDTLGYLERRHRHRGSI